MVAVLNTFLSSKSVTHIKSITATIEQKTRPLHPVRHLLQRHYINFGIKPVGAVRQFFISRVRHISENIKLSQPRGSERLFRRCYKERFFLLKIINHDDSWLKFVRIIHELKLRINFERIRFPRATPTSI